MSKSAISLALAVGLLLSGCASMHPPAQSLSQGEVVADEARTVTGKKSQPDDDAVYYMLAAELAGQRGQYEAALDNYLKASTLTTDVKVLQRAAQIALYLKKNDKALEAATLWQRREPDSLEAQRLLAMLSLKNKRSDEALQQLTQLLNMPGVDVENTMIDVVKLLTADMTKDEGAQFMRRLSENFPHLAELHFATALLASDTGDYARALAETEKALVKHPDWSRARLLQAQVMSKMGESDKARSIIQKALKADPDNSRLRLIYSQLLAKAGNVRAAEQELSKIVAKEPRNEDALLGLAMAQLESGKEAKARQLFERLAQTSNRKPQAFLYLGLIDARQGKLEDALEWFDRASEGPTAYDAQVNAVNVLIKLGRIAEARERLAYARKLNPQQALRLYLLEGELLSKSKEYDAAFALLSQALEAMPGQVELLYTRALIAEELGKTDQLEADLQAVLQKNPDDPNALNALGFTLADRSQRLDEAKKYIARSLALKPDDPAILDSYGWVHYRLGDYSTALEYLGKAYRLIQDPEIGAHFGEVLWESGKQQQAKKVWLESLRKDPEHKNLKKIMERYPDAFK